MSCFCVRRFVSVQELNDKTRTGRTKYSHPSLAWSFELSKKTLTKQHERKFPLKKSDQIKLKSGDEVKARRMNCLLNSRSQILSKKRKIEFCNEKKTPFIQVLRVSLVFFQFVLLILPLILCNIISSLKNIEKIETLCE